MQDLQGNYKSELQQELKNILSWWEKHTVDEDRGGHFGKVDHTNKIHPEAPKGSVMHSRILWAYSAAYNLTGEERYIKLAERAFRYSLDHFIDREFGGVYWTVDAHGKPLDAKKQVYALSFAVYALSEYSRACEDEKAKEEAVRLYRLIVEKSHDGSGYIEALTRDWQEIKDLRLSEKDANEKKSMNTHLHVLEGFTNLYRIWPDQKLKAHITELIRIFLDHIIHPENHHLALFFDENWKVKSDGISYGHDIEAAWLVQEAAEVIGEKKLLEEVKTRSVKIAESATEGLDQKDGGLWYEYEPSGKGLVKEKHWWPQSEAMVGFFNAWQISGEEKYLQLSLNNWKFVQQHILDKENGEWVWGVHGDYSVMKNEDKAGVWKCPYHNGRACIEIITRIEKMKIQTIKTNRTPW